MGLLAAPSPPHLPPGRAPGVQTTRNQKRPGVAMLVAVVGAAMAAAGVWVALGGRGAGFDQAEEALGGSLFAGIGLLCVCGGYVMYRRRRPRRGPVLPGVQLRAQPEARRGAELMIELTVAPGTPVRDLQVGLICVERYDRAIRHQAGELMETLEHIAYQDWQPVDGPTHGFAIPQSAPYSYEGTHVSYAWRVSARRQQALRTDSRTDLPVWVSP